MLHQNTTDRSKYQQVRNEISIYCHGDFYYQVNISDDSQQALLPLSNTIRFSHSVKSAADPQDTRLPSKPQPHPESTDCK